MAYAKSALQVARLVKLDVQPPFKVYVMVDFASLGPRNYETEILISEADQLLKIRKGFLFWFFCFVLVVQRAA